MHRLFNKNFWVLKVYWIAVDSSQSLNNLFNITSNVYYILLLRIFTFRTILTAAHCICRYYDSHPGKLTNPIECQLNHQYLTNQQTNEHDPRSNFLYVWLRGKQAFHGHTVEVEKAYVMATTLDPLTNRVVLGDDDMDIGIIITKRIGLFTRKRWGLEKLKLPDM